MSAQQSIRASTQEHLSIKNIQDGIVFLKNGSSSLVLKTTAINFGLLSEKEQEATIFAYAGFLNSLTFSIQILISSRQKDVSSYLALIDQYIKSQKKEKLKIQTQKYRSFIEKTVKKNKVLDKNFYIIIPFTPIQFKKISQKGLIEKAKTDLFPKKDHLISQFQRLGLKAIQLNNQELIQLFYNIYNPESGGQKIVSPDDYAVSFVKPETKQSPAIQKTQIIQPKKPLDKSQISKPLNQLIPKIQENKILQGKKLQDKIKNIVKINKNV